ncbi:hypothetical protein DL770_000892 [Monosporascus sp. CRB-9-2]|nr:hypothetical protein DL770_000892 [Monosporascus sp. CRB-9-2]
MGPAVFAKRDSSVSRIGPGDVAAQDLISWKTVLCRDSPSPCRSARRVRLGPAATAGTPDKTVVQYTCIVGSTARRSVMASKNAALELSMSRHLWPRGA